MKKYFKYLFIILLISLIVPQIALASWWNPFSWKIFNRTDTKTQVLEKRIKELENKLNIVVPTTPVVKDIKPTPKKTSDTNKIVETPTPKTTPIVPESTVITPTPAKVVVPPNYINPKTGALYTATEIAQNAIAECASRNSVVNKANPFNSDGTTNCITYNQVCQNKFGAHSIASSEKDSVGNRLCGCESGYESNGTSCQLKQTSDYNPPWANSGTSFSPEQLNAMDCATYGINCPTINVHIVK